MKGRTVVAMIISILLSLTCFAGLHAAEVKLTASDGAIYLFGISVSIYGDYAIVGAPVDVSGIGSAYIFQVSDGTQLARLTASDGEANDFFGVSVSIYGDYAIVGAYQDDSNKGSAYIFEKPVGGWTNMTETAKLTASDGLADDYFGNSVSIYGDYAIVGAYQDDSYKGSAYIFEKPVGGWTNMTETAKLTASDGEANDCFGISVSIYGDYAIVGAPGDDSNKGSAYIFEKPGGGWTNMTQTAKLTASDGLADDCFGFSVSIYGDYAIVGAYQDDSKGSAYSFLRSGGSWHEKKKQTASDGAAGDLFGNSVSIYGDYAIVGARQDDSYKGSAYIYYSIDDLSLPVELSAFTATISGDNVILKWRTETETNNVGFSIYRSEAKDGKYTRVAFVSGAGSTPMPTDYQFIDQNAEAGKTYFYYLEDVDVTGEKNKSNTIKVVVPPAKPAQPIPKVFRLLQNYPNPFNPETWIPFDLAADANVIIRIYDMNGQLVRQFDLINQKAGSYLDKKTAAYWNGKDQLGQSVSSGIYFYTLKAGDFVATRRMVILK
jgi:hypothetical protein